MNFNRITLWPSSRLMFLVKNGGFHYFHTSMLRHVRRKPWFMPTAPSKQLVFTKRVHLIEEKRYLLNVEQMYEKKVNGIIETIKAKKNSDRSSESQDRALGKEAIIDAIKSHNDKIIANTEAFMQQYVEEAKLNRTISKAETGATVQNQLAKGNAMINGAKRQSEMVIAPEHYEDAVLKAMADYDNAKKSDEGDDSFVLEPYQFAIDLHGNLFHNGKLLSLEQSRNVKSKFGFSLAKPDDS